MGIHGQSSNFKTTANTRNARKFRKERAKQRRNGVVRQGDVKPGDIGIIPKGILRRRKTNPFAPIDLSGKRRRKIMKELRRQEKAKKTMDVTPAAEEAKMETKKDDAKPKEKVVSVTDKMEIN